MVPPISETSAVLAPAKKAAPACEAAGPESTVSTGRALAKSACNNEPSPLTTINGQVIPKCAICCDVASIRRSSKLISRAFSIAVSARLGPPRLEDNSCEHVTGRPVISRNISRAIISCSGLRVAKCEATAKADTSLLRAIAAFSSSSLSRAASGAPSLRCPPVIKICGSLPRALARSARSNAPSSKPISTRPTRPPTPSTTAFVAKVVDKDTKEISAGLPPHVSTTAFIAPPTPMDKS